MAIGTRHRNGHRLQDRVARWVCAVEHELTCRTVMLNDDLYPLSASLTLSPKNASQRALPGKKTRPHHPLDGSRHFRCAFRLSKAIAQTPAKQGHFSPQPHWPPHGRAVNQRRPNVRGARKWLPVLPSRRTSENASLNCSLASMSL